MLVFAVPAGAPAQNGFDNFSQAPEAQYHEPTPTPTPTPAATATASSDCTPRRSQGSCETGKTNPSKSSGGGKGNGGKGSGKGEDDGLGVAPDSAGNAPGSAGGGSGVLPLTDAQGGGKLPFTGLDLYLVVLMGLLLVGAGFVARVVARTRRRAASSA